MIAQPSSTTSKPEIGSEIQQELVVLRAKLDDAFRRISALELQANYQPQPSALFAIDAPPMEFAKKLCAEIFPGPFNIEVACAPDDPAAQWYVFHVQCSAEMRESIDREISFGLRLHDAFPKEAGDIRLAVSMP
jgi:hypothetical protein